MAEKYQELISRSMGALDAHFTVSWLLGHERADVTSICLPSVRKSDSHVRRLVFPKRPFAAGSGACAKNWGFC